MLATLIQISYGLLALLPIVIGIIFLAAAIENHIEAFAGLVALIILIFLAYAIGGLL